MKINRAKDAIKELYKTNSVTALMSERGVGKTSVYKISSDENYQEYFQKLKTTYGTYLKGRVVVRVTCYATFSSIVDFNQDDNKIFVY